MDEYVSKEYVFKCMKDSYDHAGISTETVNKVRRWLNRAPTIEIVRCKDCKRYGGRQWENNRTGICGRTDSGVSYDGFCSYGQRKEADE